MKQEFLLKLIEEENPCEAIFSFIESAAPAEIELDRLVDFYHEFERYIAQFELWLYEMWGPSFYKDMLLKTNTSELSVNIAFKLASQLNGNVLICDGFSLREAIIVRRTLSEHVIDVKVGYAPAPTDTNTAAKVMFGCSTMAEAFSGSRIIHGKLWRMHVVKDIKNPPRIGTRDNYALWTYDPDARLHRAEEHGVKIHDIKNIVEDIIHLIQHLLSIGRPLVVTGEHGYIFLGRKPSNAFWSGWQKIDRIHETCEVYGDLAIKVDDRYVASGRKHGMPRRGSFIIHGGVSLAESMVPIIILKAI